MARPRRFERPTPAFGVSRISILELGKQILDDVSLLIEFFVVAMLYLPISFRWNAWSNAFLIFNQEKLIC